MTDPDLLVLDGALDLLAGIKLEAKDTADIYPSKDALTRMEQAIKHGFRAIQGEVRVLALLRERIRNGNIDPVLAHDLMDALWEVEGAIRAPVAPQAIHPTCRACGQPMRPIRCAECGGTSQEPRGECGGVLHPFSAVRGG